MFVAIEEFGNERVRQIPGCSTVSRTVVWHVIVRMYTRTHIRTPLAIIDSRNDVVTNCHSVDSLEISTRCVTTVVDRDIRKIRLAVSYRIRKGNASISIIVYNFGNRKIIRYLRMCVS